jgi:hypothetical protein
MKIEHVSRDEFLSVRPRGALLDILKQASKGQFFKLSFGTEQQAKSAYTTMCSQRTKHGLQVRLVKRDSTVWVGNGAAGANK